MILLDIVLVVGFLIFVVLQVGIPLLQGTPLFPLFRKDEVAEAEALLKELNEDEIAQAVREVVEAKRAELQHKKEKVENGNENIV